LVVNIGVLTAKTSSSRRLVGLEAGVDGFGLQGEYGENTFVYAPERLTAGDPFQGLHTQRVLAGGHRSLMTEVA
jgi:hypothetical protein